MEQLELDLNLIKIFLKVVDCKSFSEASRVLKIPKSTVSRAVSSLEKELGIQLIVRTTRHFNLTQQGTLLFLEAKKNLNELEATLNSVLKSKEDAKGLLRITAPLDLGVNILNPLLLDFAQQNPFINLEVEYTDEVVNIVKEGFDLALRIGQLKDGALKAKKIGETSFGLYASPQYILKHGECHKIDDLERFEYLHFSRVKDIHKIKFSDGKKSFVLKNKPHISLNNLECLKQLILSGNGFSPLPDFFAQSEVEKGVLVPVLKNMKSPANPISWVFPLHKESSHLSRYFRDYMTPQIQRRLV